MRRFSSVRGARLDVTNRAVGARCRTGRLWTAGHPANLWRDVQVGMRLLGASGRHDVDQLGRADDDRADAATGQGGRNLLAGQGQLAQLVLGDVR